MIMVGKIYAGKDNSAKLITHPARGNGNLVINSSFHNISSLHIPNYIIGEAWTVAADSDDWTVGYHNPGITLTNNHSSGHIYLVQKLGRVARGVYITATCKISSTDSSGNMYMERYNSSGTSTVIVNTPLDTAGVYHITGRISPAAVVDHANIVIAVNPGKALRIDWCRVDEDTSLPSDGEFVNIAMTRLEAKYHVQRAYAWQTYQGMLGWGGTATFHISDIVPRIVPSIWYYRDPGETAIRPVIYLANGTNISVQESQFQARVWRNGLDLDVNGLTPDNITIQAILSMNSDEIIFNAL
jgi:hypothetical protein